MRSDYAMLLLSFVAGVLISMQRYQNGCSVELKSKFVESSMIPLVI